MLNADNIRYLHFTGPMRMEKQVHTLEGLLTGIASDGHISSLEVSALSGWKEENQEFSHRHPFSEIIPRIEDALSDGIIDEDERQDLLWLCSSLKQQNRSFDKITVDLQRLHGILGGIAADGKITEDELRSLGTWLEEHEHLRSCWPFDEIDSLLTAVLSDGIIDESEHQALLTYFNEFVTFGDQRAIDIPDNWDQNTIKGVCSVCPTIEFTDRMFCFTGKSERYTRRQLAEIVTRLGGMFSDRVTYDVDYLVIGADGNPCWAFACYGRKVEQAISYRKSGHNIVLVHEYDIYDAIEDAR